MNLIKVSDVVDELSLSRRDHDRQQYLRYLVLSKTVLRDLKIKYLNDFKRVYLAVNQSTNTVRIPFDFYRLRTLSIIEDCKDRFGRTSEKVIPLTINPYINITPQETITCENSCNCEISHPVCQELANYELIEEEITIPDESSPTVVGTRQTILRTCANGDIIKEVTEPVQKWVEGTQQCNYGIVIQQSPRTICDYIFDFAAIAASLPFIYPLAITMMVNGVTVTSGSLANSAAVDAFFATNGWTKVGTFSYTILETSDIWGLEVLIVSSGPSPIENNLTLQRSCTQVTTIEFPFTITSYVLNGETVTPSPAETIVYQSDLDTFFAELGFTKVDDTHYTIEDTEDVYFSMTIETGDSPSVEVNINFIQTGCHRPLESAGYQNQLFTDVLCNVPVKECGCILETESAISTIVSCCGSFLNCCQVGELSNWSGWNVVPACCPTNNEQPYNRFGEYNIDEKNFLIYLSSVNASRVLLAYDSDGVCDGEYVIPDYCMNAMKGGIAHYAAQYDETISPQRRRELKGNYNEEIDRLIADYTDPLRMPDLINALKTRKYPY